ncbi:MAG: hypothetical protein CL609_19660 [Anaerolineaceae bacterium]|nr:hypothetical protein [Anaerolineaceae bacterium]
MAVIFADTTSSIPTEEAKQLGIEFLPQIIVFGDDTYRDDYEMDSTTFINRLKTEKDLPKTAAPPPALYGPLFEKHLNAGNTIIVLTPSQKVSGTFRSAEVAAQDFASDKIHVIDTQSIGASLASIVKSANDWCKAELEDQEIIQNVENLISREQNLFVVDTLEYLHKGGRIGGAKMLVGSLLQVKPILSLRKGQVEPVESQRTKKKALSRLKELVLENCPTDASSKLAIQHGGALEDAQMLAKDFEQTLNIPHVPIYHLPPAFLVHAGPGVMGVSYFIKD